MNSEGAYLILTIALVAAYFVQPPGVGLACTPGMSFVADVTVPDDTHFSPGQTFDKTWRLQNAGDCEWSG